MGEYVATINLTACETLLTSQTDATQHPAAFCVTSGGWLHQPGFLTAPTVSSVFVFSVFRALSLRACSFLSLRTHSLLRERLVVVAEERPTCIDKIGPCQRACCTFESLLQPDLASVNDAVPASLHSERWLFNHRHCGEDNRLITLLDFYLVLP